MSSKSLALLILSLFSSLGWSQSCENLLSKSIPNASIKESHIVMAGEFDAPEEVLGVEEYMMNYQSFAEFRCY